MKMSIFYTHYLEQKTWRVLTNTCEEIVKIQTHFCSFITTLQ